MGAGREGVPPSRPTLLMISSPQSQVLQGFLVTVTLHLDNVSHFSCLKDQGVPPLMTPTIFFIQSLLISATQCLRLLLFTCLLALAASLPALDITNLHLLNGTLDGVMNVPPESSQLDNGSTHVRQVRDVAPHPLVGHGWPKDCSEIPTSSRSGVYIIQPKGLHPIVVSCEMNVTNGGWTVIQRNQRDTAVTWAESWSTYKYGFGSVHSEYWLGTEYIHQISQQKVYQVRFVIQDSTGKINFSDYNLFSVEDESHGYRLRLGAYSGTAGDAMTSDNPTTMHDNMKFSTKDRDQDTYSKNCAYSYEGGWWYSACYSVRLNFKGGMTWGSLCKGNCKSSLILIKPAPYC
ncbi:fibrinogen-like protein 1-like protein [Strix aluco]|uniref:fibrinogen-like protein 1-like protein n=1 Tax=Strix aluco TaxID=111821 RepID=UPI003DA3C7D5